VEKILFCSGTTSKTGVLVRRETFGRERELVLSLGAGLADELCSAIFAHLIRGHLFWSKKNKKKQLHVVAGVLSPPELPNAPPDSSARTFVLGLFEESGAAGLWWREYAGAACCRRAKEVQNQKTDGSQFDRQTLSFSKTITRQHHNSTPDVNQ
jgi:hypothetical protein